MKQLITFLTFLGLGMALKAQNKTIYVRPGATGLNDGTSWQHAYTDLQTALGLAQKGDQVWVAAGIYLPGIGSDPLQTFEIKSGVRAYGGFSGNEASPSARDLVANMTLLSGDIGAPGLTADNVFNVVYMHEPDSTTLLDGFVVRGGYADSDQIPDVYGRSKNGGGLYISGAAWVASPNIVNCRFEQNRSRFFGGGCFVNGGEDAAVSPRFKKCVFEGNRSRNGGGVARRGADWTERGADFESCAFLRNRADFSGGGLYHEDAERSDTFQLVSCRFEENFSAVRGGGGFLSLGREMPGHLSILSCSFAGDTALSYRGAGLLGDAGSFLSVHSVTIDSLCIRDYKFGSSNIISIEFLTDPQSGCSITNTRVEDNKVAFAISVDVFDKLHVRSLYAEGNNIGTAVNSGSKKFDVEHAIFRNNTFSTCFNSIPTSTVSINNVLVANNSLLLSRYWDGSAFSTYKLRVRNSTFVNNLYDPSLSYEGWIPEIIEVSNCYFNNVNKSFMYSLYRKDEANPFIHTNVFDTLICEPPFQLACQGNNLIGTAPLFRDTASGDYRLLPCSPLVGAGNNTGIEPSDTDLNGKPRIQGGTVDIGCYEARGLGLAASPSVTASCVGLSPAQGSVSLGASDGCEPYAYQWYSATAGQGSDTTGLQAGTYQFTVTDGNGHSASVTVEVPLGLPPQLSPVVQDLVCGSPVGGSVSVSPTGGTPPYAYHWSNEASTATLVGLPAGSYAVTVGDSAGCEAMASLQVGSTGGLVLQVAGSVVSCHGLSDGWYSAAALTGKPPYTYAWAHGEPDSLAEGLGAGAYSVTVVDGFGCTGTYDFVMPQPDSLRFLFSVLPASAATAADGCLGAIGVQGGNPPYLYGWSNGAVTELNCGLLPGPYSLTLSDQKGCSTVLDTLLDFTNGTSTATSGGYRLYPNPARDHVFVAGVAGAQRYRLVDASGRVNLSGVFGQGPDGSLRASFPGVPSGTYTLLLSDAVDRYIGWGKMVVGE